MSKRTITIEIPEACEAGLKRMVTAVKTGYRDEVAEAAGDESSFLSFCIQAMLDNPAAENDLIEKYRKPFDQLNQWFADNPHIRFDKVVRGAAPKKKGTKSTNKSSGNTTSPGNSKKESAVKPAGGPTPNFPR